MDGSVSKYFSTEKGTMNTRQSKRKPAKIVVKYEDVECKQEPGEEEKPEESKKLKWQPENWLQVIENIGKMRSKEEAPVDTMGCHKCHDEEEVSPQTKRFQILVALMLSSQTKDQVTHAAMLRLREVGLSTKSVISMSDEKLGDLIRPVGFWRKKVNYLKGAAKAIEDEYGGDIPTCYEDLCKLNGVGPKMAHLTMMTAWKKVTGIAVDTHVHRIANRLGWVRAPSSQPTKTMEELESWLPQEHWLTINHL